MTPGCNYITHSTTWGNCRLCTECFNRTHWLYNSYARPLDTKDDADLPDTGGALHLDDPLYKNLFRGHDVYANLTLGRPDLGPKMAPLRA